MDGGHGGHGGGQHTGPQIKLYVRWESAKPVLEALQQPLPETFASHYVISVNGIPLSETHARDDQGDDEDLADRLKSMTYLETKEDMSVQPGLAQRSPAATSSSFLFSSGL